MTVYKVFSQWKFKCDTNVIIYINPHTNMRGPHRPRKTLKAAQTLIIGFSESMIIHNTE